MNEEPNKEDPVKKFRKLQGSSTPKPEPPQQEKNVLASLPKRSADAAPTKDSGEAKPSVLTKIKAAATAPQPKPDLKPASPPKERSSIFGPRFWTIASLLSLTTNVILVIVLLVLAVAVNRLGFSVSYLMGLGNNLLGLPSGLYANFEKMDRASIQTNVEVNTTIPVKFDLQLNQQTNVVLSQDVTISNALVTVNTGGLNIARANTTIVLPQGTTLPILLNLTVPVDTQVPVTLNVPVDIPLSNTQLHEPFVGLQEVIKPLYCALNKNAQNLDGQPICP